MKVCPECESRYEADVELCPNDGAELVDAALPANPEMQEVQPVAAHEATSMIDLEALEHARREQMLARGEDPDAPPSELGEEDEPGADAEEISADPEATGVIDTDLYRRIRRGEEPAPVSAIAETSMVDGEVSAPSEHAVAAIEDESSIAGVHVRPSEEIGAEDSEYEPDATNDDENIEPSEAEASRFDAAPADELSEMGQAVPDTYYDEHRYEDERYVDPNEIEERLQQARFARSEYTGEYTGTHAEETTRAVEGYALDSGAKPARWMLPLVGLVLVCGLVGSAWAWAQSEVVTITTLPPGANVWMDNEHLGKSPLQKRMWLGKHKLTLHLPEHVKFEDLIDVTRGGLRFEQRLEKMDEQAAQADESTPGDVPAAEVQSADSFVQIIEVLLAANDLDKAFATTKRMLKQFPTDRRGDALLDRVIELRVEETATARSLAAIPPPKKVSRPKDDGKAICAKALELYEIGDLEIAKQKLQKCVQLRPQHAKAHRTLGRIFESEKNLSKVRYHLQRYLDVGGDDVDGRVEAWLKSHPRRK